MRRFARRHVAAAALLVALAATPAGAATASVVLEPAPLELGEFTAAGGVLMTATAKGKELLLLAAEEGVLHTFLESGSRWGDPLQLSDETGAPFSLTTPATIAAGDGRLAVSGLVGSYLFDLAEGTTEASAVFRFTSDVERTPQGWAVGLVNMPHPMRPGRAFHRDRFGDGPPPRVAVFDGDWELWRQGLADEPAGSGSVATGRRLRLAWDGRRLYAAELANYRIFALDRKLELRATYLDPTLVLEEGVGGAAAGDLAAREERMLRIARRQPRDAAAPPGPSAERPLAVAETFDYQPVIHDIAWDGRENRLLLLLAAGVVGGAPTLDRLDPESGRLRRVELRLPADAEPARLSQVVAGHRYLWFRSYLGAGRVYRLSRDALLDRGLELEVPVTDGLPGEPPG